MENTLDGLIGTLESTLKFLNGDAKILLQDALHNDGKLPDKKFSQKASRAVDLLHQTEQLLEPGPLVLADHFLGYLNTKCLVTAVELGVPDALRTGSMTISDLANACDARPDRLRQIMRTLYNNGIFSYDKTTCTYSNNSTSTMLLSDHWTQWRNFVDFYGNEFYDMTAGLPAACHKNAKRTPAQIHFDTNENMFTYFMQKGWLPRMHKTLSGGAIAQAPGILEDYPWEEIADHTFLDIGGGGGGLVALVLRKYEEMHAGIFDLPRVVEHAAVNFHTSEGPYADVGNRVSKDDLISGDFLVEVPSFEVYTMKWCLHDWDDSDTLKIMKNIRKAIVKGPKSRLIIMECLLTDGRMGRLSRLADINMMVAASGQERDEVTWRSLAEQSGWTINHIYHLRNSWPCAIELVPKWDWANGVSEDTWTATESKSGVEEQPANLVNGISKEKPEKVINVSDNAAVSASIPI
ncbi:hypothetical protein MMC11_004279 [Xylographa trunciseda]|nr:hypothetical protein [Xylographa trunciseda]